jgi:sulfite reductase (NADPH) hemoprotein beta-component
VAPIAYQCSDVVFLVQPTLAEDNEFSERIEDFKDRKTSGLVARAVPEIVRIRQIADPLLSAFEPLREGKLVSIHASSSILLRSIPHLYKLAHYPVVIHVAVEASDSSDFSDITAIRNCGFTFLQSESLQETQDIGLSAHALAIKSGKGVFHFYNADIQTKTRSISTFTNESIADIIQIDLARVIQSKSSKSTSLYVDDGHRANLAIIGGPAVQNGNGSANGESSVVNTQAPTPAKGQSTDSSQAQSGASSDLDSASVATSAEPVTMKQVSSEDVYQFASEIWSRIQKITSRKYTAFTYTGPKTAETVLFVFGADTALFNNEIKKSKITKTGVASVRLYRPWLGAELAAVLPASVKKIGVLEQLRRKTTKWGPILMDLLMSLRSTGGVAPTIVGYQLGFVTDSSIREVLQTVIKNLQNGNPIQNLQVGDLDAPKLAAASQPAVENAYMKILNQLFGENIFIANQLDAKNAGISPEIASSPEYGFGSLTARIEKRQNFIQSVQSLIKNREISDPVTLEALTNWVVSAKQPEKANIAASDATKQLGSDNSPISQQLLSQKELFTRQSQWLIGSDAWSYDLGNSGVHNVVASGANVNMLIIDSTPYSERNATNATRRKKDIGLYAMNYGSVYVASVAVYSSYTQVLEAMIEADQFDGPSIVLAYLPYAHENESPLAILQETKNAVDIGYWPLYRWNPHPESPEDRFHLDSERLKKEVEDFLRRDNYLTQVMRKHPEFAKNLSGSYGTEVRAQQKRNAKDAYSDLLEGLAGAPVTILFASDNGNAENLSKRLGNRGKARGLKTIVMAMDDYPIEDINGEENIVLISSTAGQGEFPQNGRNFWEAVKNATDIDLATVNFAVFALGDSHYWPRKQDKIYYNKPGKDLHARLLTLGGHPLTECGLGDDQDPDSYQTGYQEWEPELWKSLGVDKIEGLPEEPPPLTNEDMKIASNFLRGTIAEGLRDTSTGAISASDQQLTKFHGTYMQDDRDLRDERKAQGLEPAYSFMIRCRLAGGVATPQQWIEMDDIATTLGNETMKLTTRQTFQFHGIVKGKLRPAMQAINRALMTTIAACGDINRNVMCSSLPQHSEYHKEVWNISQKISDHLLPCTTAYHEIWLQEDDGTKTQVAGEAIQDYEPLYGPTYLPRKFKITIAIPPHNDTDVYAHDVGLIAIKGSDGHLQGFNILAGGGMGVTHNNKKTYPQVGRMFGYVPVDQAHIVCEKIMLVQRDHGDRKNRKHARLKYTIDDMGLDVYIGKVEELLGWKFEPPRPFKFESNVDTFGWQKDEYGLNHFTFFIENGRIEDTPDFAMKTGLRAVASAHKGEFRLTGNQHLILSNVADADLPAMKSLLQKYKLDNTAFSGLRLSSSACVAFPTCGLAMAESERYLPELITKLESTLFESGLNQDSIVMRMTGCPNGCARPWLAEVAFVGKAFGAYNMYLGGGYHGQRLNKLYRSSIKEDEILEIMRPLIRRYAKERETGERFGDFCIRSGVIVETKEGRDFHENVSLCLDNC